MLGILIDACAAGVPGQRAGDVGHHGGAVGRCVGGWVGARERRVAASLVVLGCASRLLGPAVTGLLGSGVLADQRPDRCAIHSSPSPACA